MHGKEELLLWTLAAVSRAGRGRGNKRARRDRGIKKAGRDRPGVDVCPNRFT
jgi:hypothetical protein